MFRLSFFSCCSSNAIQVLAQGSPTTPKTEAIATAVLQTGRTTPGSPNHSAITAKKDPLYHPPIKLEEERKKIVQAYIASLSLLNHKSKKIKQVEPVFATEEIIQSYKANATNEYATNLAAIEADALENF